MHESKVQFFKKPADDIQRLEPSTCTEAETFVLQVLDDSMEPEFAKHCMIVIDPTGHARDGSYVLARCPDGLVQNTGSEVDQFHFRQLRKTLHDCYRPDWARP